MSAESVTIIGSRTQWSRHLRVSLFHNWFQRENLLLAYLSLFVTAFVAATILPAYSEVVLGGLVMQGYAVWWLWLSATAGNTLGSVVNGVIGRQIDRFEGKRWFPHSEQQLAKARERFNRYGQWSLLLAWLPIVGDPLTLVGGVMRVPWFNFVVLVAVGKGLRYAVVLWIAMQSAGYFR